VHVTADDWRDEDPDVYFIQRDRAANDDTGI